MKDYRIGLLTVLFAAIIVSCSSPQKDCDKSVAYMLRPHCELPAELGDEDTFTGIFLAGTIDMGTGEDWQAGLLDHFSSKPGRYLLYNPRQEHWDASRPGEMDYQVNWELEHLEKSDVIIMNILPGSKSPITLLELGLFARSGKLHVVCTPEFYRYDNVRITCARYGVPLYATLDELLSAIPSASDF